MTKTFTFYDNIINSINEIPSDSIVSKTVFKSEKQKAILFGFAAGQELSDHTSALNAILHIIKGEGVIRVEGETISANPGTWIHLQPEVVHSVIASSELFMLLYLFPD